MPLLHKLSSFAFLCFAACFFLGCGSDLDTQGAERLQFCKLAPPNIKTDYELILGNVEAQKYKDVHGPVKRILQRNYEIAKDEKGNLLPPHFSGTSEINYLPSGEIADFSSYDSTGVIVVQAIVINKSNRKEIYLHFSEDNRDFVYILDKNGRIIEEGKNPVYKHSDLDGTWNSTDGHFSWEENGKGQIIAAHGTLPSGNFRHLYEYDSNDSLVRIRAFNSQDKEIGSMIREFKDGKLHHVTFRFDERWLYPNILNYYENYAYDSKGRLTSVITNRFDPWSEAGSWPPFHTKDTLKIVYSDNEGLSEKDIYQHGDLESRTIYDTLGNATLIETFGSFIYEGAFGTGEAYDVQREIRTIEYYGNQPPAHLADSLNKAKEKKQAPTSLAANEFLRHPTDSSSLLCSNALVSVKCVRLNGIPSTDFLNYISSISYKNTSEIFLTRQICKGNVKLLFSEGKCAMVLCSENVWDGLLFNSSLVTFKRDPYKQFAGDTIVIPTKDFPCEFK
ncbi:MAG: hypothetical protein M0P13_10730 [Fibrobacteraceae bacterium]|nr:hypothetical protein [Fibrobacteraceae bacterium]